MKALWFILGAWLCSCSLWMPPDPQCSQLEISSDHELLIASTALRSDSRAQNAGLGPWSMAAQMARLQDAEPSLDAREFWSELTGETSAPEVQTLPFRLTAIVNRTDLDREFGADSDTGELRFVYTMTDGPGDSPAARALPLTVIFEYSLGSEQTPSAWVARFHDLASATSSDEHLNRLDALVTSVTHPASSTPEAPQLSRIRVNDARTKPARLYEFVLSGSTLKRHTLRNTPERALAGSPELDRFVHQNTERVLAGSHRVPAEWLAQTASLEDIEWVENDRELQHAFSRGTCSGCHGTDGPSSSGFHVREDESGNLELSEFLLQEELPRRRALMQAALCAEQ